MDAMLHFHHRKCKRWEAYMVEQRAPSQTQTQKKEVKRGKKQGWVTCEEHETKVWESRHEVRKAKVHMELNLANDIKDTKCFYKYIGDKKKSRQYVSPLLQGFIGTWLHRTWKRMRYWMPSSPKSLLARLDFRNPRCQRAGRNAAAGKTYPSCRKIRTENTSANTAYVSLWALMGCISQYWGCWQMSLWGYSQ